MWRLLFSPGLWYFSESGKADEDHTVDFITPRICRDVSTELWANRGPYVSIFILTCANISTRDQKTFIPAAYIWRDCMYGPIIKPVGTIRSVDWAETSSHMHVWNFNNVIKDDTSVYRGCNYTRCLRKHFWPSMWTWRQGKQKTLYSTHILNERWLYYAFYNRIFMGVMK